LNKKKKKRGAGEKNVVRRPPLIQEKYCSEPPSPPKGEGKDKGRRETGPGRLSISHRTHPNL